MPVTKKQVGINPAKPATPAVAAPSTPKETLRVTGKPTAAQSITQRAQRATAGGTPGSGAAPMDRLNHQPAATKLSATAPLTAAEPRRAEQVSGNAKPPMPSEQVAALTSQDSPLMRQAATQGRQYAQSRGLVNASLGAQAAQEAVIGQSMALTQMDVQAQQFEADMGIRQQLRKDQVSQFADTQALSREQMRQSWTQFQQQMGFSFEELRQRDEQFTEQLGLNKWTTKQQNALQERLEGERMDLAWAQHTTDAGLRQRAMDIDEEKNRFYQNLDMERFKSEESYRERAMAQEAEIAAKQRELQREMHADELADKVADRSFRGGLAMLDVQQNREKNKIDQREAIMNRAAAEASAIMGNEHIPSDERNRIINNIRAGMGVELAALDAREDEPLTFTPTLKLPKLPVNNPNGPAADDPYYDEPYYGSGSYDHP